MTFIKYIPIKNPKKEENAIRDANWSHNGNIKQVMVHPAIPITHRHTDDNFVLSIIKPGRSLPKVLTTPR